MARTTMVVKASSKAAVSKEATMVVVPLPVVVTTVEAAMSIP